MSDTPPTSSADAPHNGGRHGRPDNDRPEDVVTASGPVTTASAGTRLVTANFEQRHLVLAMIVVAQIVWLGYIGNRGWFLQADISNLADTIGTPLNWSYLSAQVGGHFGPVVRAVNWLLQHTAPMDHSLSLDFRLAMQATSTVLLYRVLVLLTRPGPMALVVTAGYAFSSLILPGVVWYTTGVGFGIAQILVLLCLLRFPRFHELGRWQDGLAMGCMLGIALVSADTNYASLVMFPLLSLGVLGTGTLWERIKAQLRHWLGWFSLALPIGAVTGVSLYYSETKSSDILSFGDVYELMRTEWLRGVGPALIAGPFRWFGDDKTYVPLYAPTDLTVFFGQLMFLVLLAVGFQRFGWNVGWVWSLPIAVATCSVLLIGTARFAVSGLLIPITPRYSFNVAVPLALAVGITLSGSRRWEEGAANQLPSIPLPGFLRGRAPLVACLVIVLLSVTSSIGFTRYWSNNPGKRYFDNLVRTAQSTGSTPNVWDTPLPGQVVSVVEPHHHVSDFLALAGVKATYNNPGSPLRVADGNGLLTSSLFLVGAQVTAPQVPRCGTLMRSAEPLLLKYNRLLAPAEWWLRISLYQEAPSALQFTAIFSDGKTTPLGGPRTFDVLGAANLRLPPGSPVAIRVDPLGKSVNVCFVHIDLGGPFPKPAE